MASPVWKRRHCALAESLLRIRPKPCVLSIVRWTQGLTIHLFGTGSHNCCCELPAPRGGRLPTQAVGFCFPPQDDSGLPAHGLAQLRVIPVLAQHQVQPHRQFARHRHLGQRAMLPHRQPPIKTAQLGVVTRRRLSRFHQQKTQKRTALFADSPQLLPSPAGVLARDQPKVAAHLARVGKTFRRSQRQHYSQRRHRAHSRMRPQPHRRRPPLHFFFHLPVQPRDLSFHLIQRGQQALPPHCSVGQQLQLLQLRPPRRRPQLPLLLHALTQHQRLQPILNPRPPLHLLVPMHQQLPHIPFLQTRHPYPRKPILHQQLQQLRRVPPVRLLLAHFRRPDPRRVPDPQLHAQPLQQPLEPGIMPASLHPHSHRLPAQRTIKLLRLLAVQQAPFRNFSRLVVKDRDLLKPRMKITAYNQHDVGSFSSLGRLRSFQLTPRSSQRRYPIKRSECCAKRSTHAVEGSLLRLDYSIFKEFLYVARQYRANALQGCHRRKQCGGPSTPFVSREARDKFRSG